MNLSDIRTAIYDTLGYPSTPDSSVQRRIDYYINSRYREVLSGKGMGRLRQGVLTFSSVAGSPFAVLPQAAVMILCIADRSTNRLLDEITHQDLRVRDPGLNFSSSIPEFYSIINMAAAVARDPGAATALYVVSDSGSDGTGVSACVEGTITGGYYRRATVAMNGTTPIAVDASSSWEHVSKFYLSGAATGTVTLTAGSGGQELSRIQPGRSYARYTQIHLAGTPASASTYYADVELHIDNLINPRDEPYIPEDFHYVLEAGALVLEYAKREKSSAYAAHLQRWRQGMADVRAYVTRLTGATQSRQRSQQFSHLPWNYPASGY